MGLVVQEHAPAEVRAQLATQMQENERLRMQLEDLRQAQFSPYDGDFFNSRKLLWREVGQIMRQQCITMQDEVIAPAVNIMEEARRNIRMFAGTPAYTEALEQAHNAMCDAEECLQNEEDFLLMEEE